MLHFDGRAKGLNYSALPLPAAHNRATYDSIGEHGLKKGVTDHEGGAPPLDPSTDFYC